MVSVASTRGPESRGLLTPVVWGTLAVVATYACFQLLAGHSAVTSAWWRSEGLRRTLHARSPKAVVGQPQPVPTTADWLPSSATAVLLVLALVVLALALVAAGRGWWLLLVSALPLLPTQVAPGTWAPELSNQVVNAVVWPAGASEPSIAWSWLSAGVEALVIAVPAAALGAVVVQRRPAVFSDEVVRLLAPVAVAVTLVVTWNWRAGQPQDWTHLARLAIWVLVGALLLTGGLRLRWSMAVLVLTAALADGLLRWTTAADSQPLAVAPTAWWACVPALLGGGWVLVAPHAEYGMRWCLGRWRAMVTADVDSRHQHRQAAARRDQALPTEVERPEREPRSDAVARAGTGRVSHRAPAAAAGGGGRHRG
jgi:hypothetical protein